MGVPYGLFPSGFVLQFVYISDRSHFSYVPFVFYLHLLENHRGGTVVKVLCYKSEGRWFDSRWCHWNFSLT